jgi:uncharacterized protein (DUF58 family)
VRELTSGALLDALRGAHWPARRMSRGAFQGGHRSRRVGASPEFMEYRPYQQGDDPSRIDWKLFGRTERVVVRLSHDDSSLRTMVLLDASGSMAFPAGTQAKWKTAAAIALGLAAVTHGDNDPVGIGIASASPRVIPPRSRRGVVGEVLRALLDTTPAGSAPLAPLFMATRTSRRVALISDFLGDGEPVLALARERVAGGTEVFAVHVVDPMERDPGEAARVVTDPENPAIRRPLGAAELEAYRSRFAEWRDALARDWRVAGAFYHEVSTADAPDRIVRRVTGFAEPASRGA